MAITKVPKVMTTDLDQVDNTSDANKPISTATQTALDLITDINWTGDYNNGVTYTVGDGVMYNGASFRMIVSIGAAGYAPPAYPANWLQITDYVSPNDIGLGDILGGATGQVLTKSSNLDGAFTWSSPGTPTLPTTTKGDLIVHNGTTDVRLPVGGTNGQILAVNSATSTGVEWTSNIPSGYAFGSIQTFTSSGTWTMPSGCRAILVEVVGGGAGGGGTALTTAGQANSAAGGSAGGYARKWIISPSTPTVVTVGSAGAGGAAAGSGGTGGIGGAGGTSSFGALVSATGGAGGLGTTASTGVRGVSPSSSAGVGSGGDLNTRGGTGGSSFSTGATTIAMSGYGGNSIYGIGGRSVVSSGGVVTGQDALGYGGGGGGSVNGDTGQAGQGGGDGSPGIVIVHEFY